jgi:hypothetical protein
MTDVAPPEEPAAEEVAAPEPRPLPPEVAAELEQIRTAAAERDAAAEAAAAAEEERLSAVDAAKAICAEKCGPIAEALAAATDENERAALQEFEARTHAEHASQLEQAYLAFAAQGEGASNPAGPGVTEVTSTSEAAAGATA